MPVKVPKQILNDCAWGNRKLPAWHHLEILLRQKKKQYGVFHPDVKYLVRLNKEKWALIAML